MKPSLNITPPGGFSRSLWRRSSDPRFLSRFFIGDGIDIGGDSDPLLAASEFFPLLKSVYTWGLEDGDALLMNGVPEKNFDFVFSSHCLEHLTDPCSAINTWSKLLKTNGHLIIELPLWELYEKQVWPSKFNFDHKFAFTLDNSYNEYPKHLLNILDLINFIEVPYELIKIEKLDHLYPYKSNWSFDNCLLPYVHSSVELILKIK
jgi:SAM-dependent methyltransferase